MPKTAEEAFAGFSKEETAIIHWKVRHAQEMRPKQMPPDKSHPNWTTWGALTGRGWGKTKVFANWLGLEAACTPKSLNAVVAPTHDDVKGVCFEGPTGLLSVIPEILVTEYNRSPPVTIRLWNGSLIRGFAGDTPERLRGPQHHNAWMDEVASFQYPEDAISNLKLGLRMGKRPKLGWSTTPKPREFLTELIKTTDVLVTGSIYENRDNLPDSFLESLLKYENTKLGRQELHGEIIDIEEMGLIKRSDWNLWPYKEPLPKFSFVIMSLDTAMTELTVDRKSHDPDFSACSVWGLFDHKGKRCMMLLDFWQDRLALNDLILRVKKERQYTYGDTQVPAFRNTAFGPLINHGNFGRPIDMILVEQQGAGRPLIQMLGTENILCYEYNPGRADKLQRLHMVSPLFAHKRVYVVESEVQKRQPKNWAEEIISQMCKYAGKGSLRHDDAMDSGAQALRYLMDNFSGPLTIAPAEKKSGGDVELVADHLTENPYSA